MSWCEECGRYFVNEFALYQHMENAAIHQPKYYCGNCERYFDNDHALKQHEQKSVKHLQKVWPYVCQPCLFGCRREEAMDGHKREVHHWCKTHDQYFDDEHALGQHLRSKAHGSNEKCPSCPCTFPTVTAVCLHLESGTCEGGWNRLKVDRTVQARDRGGVITNRNLIGYGAWQGEEDVWATADEAWNGRAYECSSCDREYNTIGKLNGHITAQHAQKRTENIYHCPNCEREFKYTSSLVGHWEHSASCTVRQDRRVNRMLQWV